MGDHHRILRQVVDRRGDTAAVLEVKLVRRLVEDQDLRIGNDDARHGDELRFSARKLMHASPCQVFDAEARKCCLHAAVDFFARKPAVFQPEGDVLGDDRHDQLVVRILEDEAGLGKHGAVVFDRIEPVDRNAAGGRLHQTVDQPGEGCLAGTVEADDADAFFVERERQGVQSHPLAEADRAIGKADVHSVPRCLRPAPFSGCSIGQVRQQGQCSPRTDAVFELWE
ncbi:hypothetical protein N182_06915 [Sinorhizobium sp. GL2]|nr:hypothetical protein N182_06915 [Sinorhizobium sp. GL2]